MENGYKIIFRTEAQAQAYKNEFTGQFSDGYWENSRRQNWKLWCGVEVLVDESGENLGCNIPSFELHYNIEEMQLQNVIGYRIIGPMRVINTLNLTKEKYTDADFSTLFDICDRMLKVNYSSDKNKYYKQEEVLTPREMKDETDSYDEHYRDYAKEKIKKAEKIFNLDDVYKALCDFKTYSNRDYNKDLKEMKKSMMTRF